MASPMSPDRDKPLPFIPRFDRSTSKSRPGWDEEKCKRYIIRNFSWVPRNFEYDDGLKLIHADLETAFGDENGDLSFGVLEELIEVEGILPFPESLFQRWKHQHRHRFDDLQLPHVPHTRTIQGPIIPTEKLQKSRSQSIGMRGRNRSGSLPCPEYAGLTDYIIDHAWFVSTRSRIRIWRLQTPSEYREKLLDPKFGRGGILLGAKFCPHAKHKHEVAQEPVKRENVLCSDCIFDIFRKFGRKHAALSDTIASSPAELLEQQGLEKNFGRLMKKMLQNEPISTFDFEEHLQKMHWPEEIGIPNANFARKFDLVPRGEALPMGIYEGPRQSSVDEEDVRILRQLWQLAREKCESQKVESELGDNSSMAHQKLFEHYLSRYISPLHPMLFYDSGLEFNWKNDPEPEGQFTKNSQQTEKPLEDPRLRSNSEPGKTGHVDKDKFHILEPKVCKAPCRGKYRMASRKDRGANPSSHALLKTAPPAIYASPTARRNSANSTRPVLPTQPKSQSMAFDDDSEDFRTFDKLFTSSGVTNQASSHDNSTRNNRKRSSTDLGRMYSTDHAQNSARPPIQTRTQQPQIRKPSSHQVLSSSVASSTPVYPPRRDSVRAFQESSASPTRQYTHRRKNSDTPSAFRSTTSTYRSDPRPNASPPLNTARSTGSSQNAQYLSESSGIIGNFVPIGAEDMASSHPVSTGSKASAHSYNNPTKIPRPNPYQFEPDTPEPYNQQRQTQFTDFMDGYAAPTIPAPGPSPRGHIKNSRSEGNDLFVLRENEPLMPPKPSYTLHRSESSPSLNASLFEAHRYRGPSPDIPDYYRGDMARTAYALRGRSPSPSRDNRTYEEAHVDYPRSQTYTTNSRTQPPFRRERESNESNDGNHYSSVSGRRSPTRRESESNDGNNYSSVSGRQSPVRHESNTKDCYHHSSASNRHSPLRNEATSGPHASASGRHSGKTPSKALHDVVERDEPAVFSPETPSRSRSESPSKSPKKRSRSPMKKMFGENGWLGRSPDEIADVKRQVKKAAAEHKDKPSMMGKLRHKLGEFAEKADISPSSRGIWASNDKNPKMSILSVSLGPPEQARLLMEVELMIVHTANTFLMSQFSQGRIAVDSIKKTVDTWKSRGRHVVIEFMYDQATQRDLVAANQHNFRFFGERAGSEVRTNSMLYNWKQVASLMAIRTFCDADTVILKLLFDVEQILELLGGAESIMLRLQQIRANSNEMMRLARQRKDARKSAQGHSSVPATPGRAATWLSHSSKGTSSRGPSTDADPYGGMRLVPDCYKEPNETKSR
ncbi:uncharacterized protein L3040_000264 [Drepanopeziza brunnea f. sp. 'multigermtubi']|uniref:uncharacterized protein n=1 Tax=Drepanopeziza brunnea f. sp. 'multigermtubi' TaxID=698441 RepID=UPI002387ED3E|nr:hypothetical protein L3040_000264 [Drepanopeziza brunnea f. sp. 'multigermtubi']